MNITGCPSLSGAAPEHKGAQLRKQGDHIPQQVERTTTHLPTRRAVKRPSPHHSDAT